MQVLVAEDDPDFRYLLGAILKLDPEMDLIGAAADASEAIRLAQLYKPDVALLDVGMPEGGGERAAHGIRAVSPGTQILALSGSNEQDAVIGMLRAGAIAYLVKGAMPDEILRAVRDTANGKTTLAPGAARELIDVLRTQFETADARDGQRARDRERIESFVAGEGIDVYLQPIFDLHNDAVVGYEALSRFSGEPRRAPNEWFERAEAIDLRADLEVAAARKALSLLSAIPSDTFLSLNLSPEVVTSSTNVLNDGDAEPGRVVVELTEHAQVGDYRQLSQRLTELRANGIRFAVDDAGAGFASLRHILQLSPEYIKLDISLTRHIDEDSPRRALAASLITFASQINATIIAEGVETGNELKTLQELGVTHGQGYYLGRPAPFGDWRVAGLTPERLSVLLRTATRVVRRAKTVEGAVSGLGNILSSALPLARVSLRILEGVEQLRLAALWSEGKTSIEAGIVMSPIATSFPEVARRDGAVSSDDCDAYPPLIEGLIRDEGVQSWVSLPVHDRCGDVSGILSFSSREPDVFGEASMGFFTLLGRVLEGPIFELAS